MSVSAGSSQISNGSRSLSLHKSDGTAPEISPHMSETELRVIESESATSSTIEILEEDVNEATTISTPTVTATPAQLKSILKSETRRERVRVQDASCQVFINNSYFYVIEIWRSYNVNTNIILFLRLLVSGHRSP